MRKGVVALLALLVSGCVTTRDQVGNVYPEICRGEMVCNATSCMLGGKMVAYVIEKEKNMSFMPNGYRAWGQFDYKDMIARISETAPNRKDVMLHEVCHGVAGRWHPE